METKSIFAEVKCDYFNEYEGCWCIDAWINNSDDDDNGRVVGWVDGLSGNIYYKNDDAKYDPLVNEVAKAKQEEVRATERTKLLWLGETLVTMSAEIFHKIYDMMPEDEKDYTLCASMVRDYAMKFDKELNWQGRDDDRDWVEMLTKREEDILRDLRKSYDCETEEDKQIEELRDSAEYARTKELLSVFDGNYVNYTERGVGCATMIKVDGFDTALDVVDVSINKSTGELEVYCAYCDKDDNIQNVTICENKLRKEHVAEIKSAIERYWLSDYFTDFIQRFGKEHKDYDTKVIETTACQVIAYLTLDGREKCELYRLIPHENQYVEFDFVDQDGNDIVKCLNELAPADIRTIALALNDRYLIDYFNKCQFKAA